ncbi:probable low affinity copper uptake protein 2 [Spea bombifrons]|uniref:probable low affinity copper uptake protein 2 n=1 Tax=Spea bombifrons TaxID=233779 RepID=UPI00234B0D76|nr:probable low affinity copper uptake protein 2 [Spea bombifrons]
MQMYFVFSENVTLLFDFWTVHTLAGLILSFLVVLLLTILYEISKVWKSNLLTRTLLAFPVTDDPIPSSFLTSDSEAAVVVTADPSQERDTISSQQTETSGSLYAGHVASNCRWWFLHCSLSLVHMVQIVLGYMLMLCVMSYNASIFIAVIIGSGLGYYMAFPFLSKYSKPHVL